MTEEWRAVVGHEGEYEVSNLGRLRSLDRITVGINGHTQQTRGRLRKPVLMQNGYCKYTLGKRKQCYAHRLVAEAFIGSPPSGTVVCHRDGDKTNNRAENLYYGTQGENIRDAIQIGALALGDARKHSRLTRATADQIRAMHAQGGKSQREIAMLFGTDQATVSRIVRGRIWADGDGAIKRYGKLERGGNKGV
jgi:predicted XRE-type DNA-binding protein